MSVLDIINDTPADFHGQVLAEKIIKLPLPPAAVVGALVGLYTGKIEYTAAIFGITFILVLI
ncbi:hypothetical protein ROZALSC1DRAFT_30389, partial [Rozella allomycis CSF55]